MVHVPGWGVGGAAAKQRFRLINEVIGAWGGRRRASSGALAAGHTLTDALLQC